MLFTAQNFKRPLSEYLRARQPPARFATSMVPTTEIPAIRRCVPPNAFRTATSRTLRYLVPGVLEERMITSATIANGARNRITGGDGNVFTRTSEVRRFVNLSRKDQLDLEKIRPVSLSLRPGGFWLVSPSIR
jgi:hypothetical protein